jgi:hypothetical protein
MQPLYSTDLVNDTLFDNFDHIPSRLNGRRDFRPLLSWDFGNCRLHDLKSGMLEALTWCQFLFGKISIHGPASALERSLARSRSSTLSWTTVCSWGPR